MLAADQRDALAEARAEHLDQHVLVGLLDLRHVFEHLGGCRKLILEIVRISEIDPRILLFRSDGERQDFLLVEGGERALGAGKETDEHENLY
jgi:hypothetical protein